MPMDSLGSWAEKIRTKWWLHQNLDDPGLRNARRITHPKTNLGVPPNKGTDSKVKPKNTQPFLGTHPSKFRSQSKITETGRSHFAGVGGKRKENCVRFFKVLLASRVFL